MTTIVYEIIIWNSPDTPLNETPSMVSHVALIAANMNGSKRGNESTGYRVPLAEDLEISAAIIVITEDNPKLPRHIVRMNKQGLLIFKSVIITYSSIINKLIIKVSVVLKISFPRNIEFEREVSFKTKEVPLSSSATKTLESPLAFEKNIIIHNKPAFNSLPIFSSPSENFIIEITTITNIARAFTAYLVRISE